MNEITKESNINQDDIPESEKLIVVLDQACLEVVKTIKGYYELLNSDDHITMLKKRKREVSDARPDIVHYCLLSLLDSPLNKSGHLKIFIKTQKNVLIDVSPHIRIPRTIKRFSGLIVQLLHKLVIRASDGPVKLLSVIKNPLEQHLPIDCVKIGLSHKADELVDLDDYIQTHFRLNKNINTNDESKYSQRPCVFVIGAMPHGHVETEKM